MIKDGDKVKYLFLGVDTEKPNIQSGIVCSLELNAFVPYGDTKAATLKLHRALVNGMKKHQVGIAPSTEP